MEVPKPRTTTPITSGEMFKWVAVLAAPSIKISELHTSKAKPISKSRLGRISDVIVIIC
jgi:hypothetical protein